VLSSGEVIRPWCCWPLVTPIVTAANKALKPISVGRWPRAIAITPNGRTAYVTNSDSGTVTPIRTATNRALKPISAGLTPWAYSYRHHARREDGLRRELPARRIKLKGLLLDAPGLPASTALRGQLGVAARRRL
jgi:YVTN family beta-propeller protein